MNKRQVQSRFTLTEVHRQMLQWLEDETELTESDHVRRALDFYFTALYRSALRKQERELNIRTKKEVKNTSINLHKIEIQSLEQADEMASATASDLDIPDS